MSDNLSLKYLFDKHNMNARKARRLAFFSEYDFEIKRIKGKDNKVDDALRRNENLNFIAIVSSYKIELDDKFEDKVKMDKNYINLREKLQKTNLKIQKHISL